MRAFLSMLAGLAVGLAIVSAAPAAGAAPYSPAAVSQPGTATSAELIDVVQRTPGARWIDADTLELQPGVQLSRVTGDASPAASCRYLYICLFSGTYHTGYRLDLTVCGGVFNLGNVAYPGGGYWNDKMSSFINNQSTGTVTRFYNWDGVSRWVYLYSSTAYEAPPTVPYDNIVDGIDVC
jgi:hypothetical protein